MTSPQQKIVQYLNEAHATETRPDPRPAVADRDDAARLLPLRRSRRTSSRRATTRDRVARRLKELGAGSNPLQAVVGLAETVVGQALALGKTPLDLLRGSGGEEKVLKNAKDAAATEALEIATYTALERLASAVGDDETAQAGGLDPRRRGEDARARPARDPEADRRRRARRRRRRPLLRPRHHRRRRGRPAKVAAQAPARCRASPRPRARSRAPSPPRSDLAIARYDSLTADEITSRLPGLSQIDLAKVDAYERREQNRTTVLSRIDTLRGDEPWAGYDELNAAEVRPRSRRATRTAPRRCARYERAHKNRAGVLKAAEREHATRNASGALT